MLWCDTLSLILARQHIPDAGRAIEITSGIDGQRYDLRQLDNEYLTVEPWCFEGDKFTVNVEAYCLSQLKFENHDQLVEALQSAPARVLTWTFVKQ